METFTLGQIVKISPCGGDRHASRGKIIGITAYLDGSTSYTVSTTDGSNGGTVRHTLGSYELIADEKEEQ